MLFAVTCPRCRKSFSITKQLTGHTGACPGCGLAMVFSGVQATPPASVRPPQSPSPPTLRSGNVQVPSAPTQRIPGPPRSGSGARIALILAGVLLIVCCSVLAVVLLLNRPDTAEPDPSAGQAANPVFGDNPQPGLFPNEAGGWPGAAKLKRRSQLTDEALQKQLLLIPEVSLDGDANTSKWILQEARGRAGADFDAIPLLVEQRTDLVGLPIRKGLDCRLGKEAAENLQALSRALRLHLEASIPGAAGGNLRAGVNDPRPDPGLLRDRFVADTSKAEWFQPEAIPALQQLLMAEHKNVRLILVEVLAQIQGKRASVALAQRALFDLHPEVREAALTALKTRPPVEYQMELIEGFRYPWPPVADHAADALVTLQLGDSAPHLIQFLEGKDPAMPFRTEVNKKPIWFVRELVRINHLGNCVLCHVPSVARAELVRGLVPTPGQPLPAPVTTPQYYEGNSGNFVRADVTYLRQDFSVYQPVANPGPWPAYQRYDYPDRPGVWGWHLSGGSLPTIPTPGGFVASHRGSGAG